MAALLLSTTIPESSLEKIEEHLGKPVKESSLAFITTAANPYYPPNSSANPEWVIEILNNTKNYFGDVDTIDFLELEDIQSIKRKYDVLFINGGNIFYLTEKVLDSNFDDVIKYFISNKLYIGGSAGACILNQDIEPLKHLDDPTVVNNHKSKGLGIIDYNILPHFDNPKYIAQIQKAEKDFLSLPTELLKLSDEAALFFSSEEILTYHD